MTKPFMIVTHAGSFHADEVAACALLEQYFFPGPLYVPDNPETNEVLSWMDGETGTFPSRFWADGTEDLRRPFVVVRTRDSALLKKACENPNVFVVDVGGQYNKDLLNFDHHQHSMQETWSDGTPYSSTGLVWEYLKRQNLLPFAERVGTLIENDFIKSLDRHDNGLEASNIAAVLAGFNRSTENPAEQNQQFSKAITVIREALQNAIFSAEVKCEAETVLTQAWKNAQKHGSTIVGLKNHITYHDCSGLLKEISGGAADLIIIPGQGNRFSLISQKLDNAFSIKNPVPEEWRGKMDFLVETARGPVLVKFAHKSGFMCVVEGTLAQAMSVGRVVVQNQKLKPKIFK